MPEASDPIGSYGKLNASVLMAVTPEYKAVKAAQAYPRKVKPRSGPLAIQPEYRQVAGVKVRIAEGGQPDGPLVLLLCPLPQSIIAFDPIWTKLGEHFRLVALDLPGFGGSEGGTEFMTFAAQGNFLVEFVQALDLHQIHIVGPDVGMAAALHYVIHHSHEVTSLMIGDGPAVAPSANGSVIEKAVTSAFWRLIFQIAGAGAFVGGANRICYLNYVPNCEEVTDYVASYADRIGPVMEWFAKYPESLATVDPYLGDLDLPVKVFWGKEDQLLYVENAYRLHEKLQRSELQIFEHCGHFSYQDQAAQFAEMVIAWVNGGYQNLT